MAVLLAACALAACAPNPNAGGDGGGDDDDDPPTDACPCPDGESGGDGGGGGGDGGGPDGQPGCSGDGGGAAQPFGNHALAYAAGAILPSHLSQGQLDDGVRGFYDAWKARYLRQGCGAGRWYVDIELDGRLTVSEAHGYGMIITAYMAGHDPQARTIFDGMVAYYLDHPSQDTPGLMAWAQDGACSDTDGANSAADGDLDIAYALLLADKQWSSGGAIDYRGLADTLLDAIAWGEVDPSGSYVQLGDWTSGEYAAATRSSDFMPGHLASFAAITGDAAWQQIADRTYAIVADVQATYAPSTGLIPDFIAAAGSDPQPARAYFLENAADGAYGYNACRDPWRIAMDFLINGDARSRDVVRRITTWIRGATGGDPYEIRPGYALDGGGLGGTYFDLAFVAPLGVAAMVDAGNQAWLNALWDATVSGGDSTYYGDTIGLLSLIAMSGNWWAPEAAPCP